jgi:hypothetical protein
MLFVDHWERLGGIDTISGEFFEVANILNDWVGCNAYCGAKNGPMPVYDSVFQYDSTHAVQSEGRCWRPAIIANGIIYWTITGSGDGTQLQPNTIAAIRTKN